MTILKSLLLGALLGMLLSPPPRHALMSTPASQATGASITPRLRVDPSDALYVIWRCARDPESGQLFFTCSPDRGQSWPQDVQWFDRESPDGSRSSGPQLASDGMGQVYAAWRTKHRDGRKDVLVSTSMDFGASFGPPLRLNQHHGAFPPEVSADGQGHVYVVWADEGTDASAGSSWGRFSNYPIYVNRSDDHGATWLPHDLPLSGKKAGGGRVIQAWPQSRSDNQGHVYVIWFDTRDGGGSLYFRASDDFGRTGAKSIASKARGGMSKAPCSWRPPTRGTSTSPERIIAMGSTAFIWWCRPTTAGRGRRRCASTSPR
jgi:hypothetical protein